MQTYDNRGKVSLWKNDKEGDTQPTLTGNLVAHRDIKEGETIRVALWKNDPEGGRPVLSGKISDPVNRNDGPSNDDVPF